MSDEPHQDFDHAVPADLLELYEVLEWQRAVEARQAAQEEGDA